MIFYKFLLCIVFLLTTLTGFISGGEYLWSGFIFVLVVGFVGDGFLPKDISKTDEYRHTWFANIILYSHLPLVLLINVIFAWHISPEDSLNIGYFFKEYFNLDLISAKQKTSQFDILGGVITMGLVYGIACTNVAHELVHRIRNKKSVTLGRWLLGFTFDTSFSIEHVFGHHQKVSTLEDASSARRGERSWAFIYRSTIESFISAWKIEKQRLLKKEQKILSFKNEIITGQFISLLYAFIYFLIAKEIGLIIFIIMAIYGKAYLEFINYIEHYGLVRKSGEKIELRHSWNSNHALSSYILYNLPRHAYHHINSMAPYWKVKACPKAPTLPCGYLIMIFLSMLPPIFNKVMKPKLLDWDLNFANDEERLLAKEANKKANWQINYPSS